MPPVMPSITLVLALFAQSVAPQLTLSKTYAGNSFFDGWVYNASAIDNTTQGNIHYLDEPSATSQQLTFVNGAGNAIIKVDNTTDGSNDPTFGRNSVKLVASDAISQGSLVVFDAVHLPFGCSVWPAFWTLDSTLKTDEGGEIDIFEGANLMENNQFTLHTKDGCNQANSSSDPFTGTVLHATCNAFEADGLNQGCGIRESSTASYGQAFAQAGGGVFAMMWDAQGIRQWFFSRPDVPSDLASNDAIPNPDGWGKPSGVWAAGGCDPTTGAFFNPQNLVIDITLCGTFAGRPEVYATSGCSGVCTDLVPHPQNYNDAYFEIKSIRTYSGGSTGRDNSDSSSGSNRAISSTSFSWIYVVLAIVACFALA